MKSEFKYPGKIVSVGEKILYSKTEYPRPYRFVKVEILYPTGDFTIVDSLLWESYFERFPNSFRAQSLVNLLISTEGELSGQSKIDKPFSQNYDLSNLSSEILWVSDKFRSNHLSLEPGGDEVIIEFSNGEVLGYDKVKFSQNYIYVVVQRELNAKYDVDIKNLDRSNLKEIMAIYLNRVIQGTLKDDKTKNYEVIWSRDFKNVLPWD